MITSNILAIFFGLLSALTIAWGTVVRHQIAEESSDEADSDSILSAISRPQWWAGLGLSFLGYGFQIVALGFGTLLVVQPILVLSLMFTLPLSAKFNGRPISKSETAWAAFLTVAVAVLVVLGRPQAGSGLPELERWLIALGFGAALFFAMYAYSLKRARDRALVLGMITGGIMGYVAVLSKAVTDIFVQGGLGELATSWEGYGLIALAVIGTAVQQLSFSAGALKNSLPAMTVVEPIFAFVLGYTILGEKFSTTGYQWIFMGSALVVMIVSTVVLSRKTIKE